MKNQNTAMVYGAYYRKSSEAEDRQAQSIADQIRDTDALAKRENITVGKRYPGESQSAFKIGRPIFNKLVEDISNGKINALLVWHPNRLARNPLDGGMLIWLMDEGKLQIIQTPSRIYQNTSSDKFMLQLEFGMSKKDSDDKSEVVKRALEGRAKRGLPHGVAHIGYLNDLTQEKGNRGWIKDPIRYPLVKKILTMMLTEKYSVRELHVYATKKLKLTTPSRKREGGKPISLSYMYTLLKDPIHAGFFYHNVSGERIRHEFKGGKPMISESQYWRIQDLLGRKGVPRYTKRQAVYNYFARCGNCNGQLSTDFKFQVICSSCKKKFSSINRGTCPGCNTAIEKMSKPTFLTYVFYYCVNNKKKRTSCPKNGIEEKNLESQLLAELTKNLLISKDLSEWCISNIEKVEDENLNEALDEQRNLEQQKITLEGKLRRLTMLRISSDHTPEKETEFESVEKELRRELATLQSNDSQENENWLEEAKRDFNFMSDMAFIIQEGTLEEKKELFSALGTNLTVFEKKVAIRNKKSVEVFQKHLNLAKEENKAFEPAFLRLNKAKSTLSGAWCQTVLRR